MVLPYIPHDGPVVSRAEAVACGDIKYYTGRSCKRGHLSQRFVNNLTCDRCCYDRAKQHREHINRLSRERRATDPEKARLADKAQRDGNPGGRRAATRKWREANLERVRAVARKWRDNNAGHITHARAARYADNKAAAKAFSIAYRLANLDAVKAKRKAKYAADAEKDKAYAKAWYAQNAEPARARHKVWIAANPEKRVEYQARRRARTIRATGSHTAADVKRIGDLQKWRCHWCSTPVAKKYHVDHLIPLSRGGSNSPRNLGVSCQSCNQRKHAKDPIVWAQQNGRLL